MTTTCPSAPVVHGVAGGVYVPAVRRTAVTTAPVAGSRADVPLSDSTLTATLACRSIVAS